MEYIPSFRDRLYADGISSFSHAITEDQKYGIPELKKFPMPDAAHVRSAIKFFNYVTPAHERQLASAILDRMQEYGISADSLNVGDKNRFKKYLVAITELRHHGIKGQHWGVRRYQNPDGTLTPEGEKRYLKNLNKASQNEMVSDFLARGYTKNYKQLSEIKRTDPEYYKKKVPKGLLEKQKFEMDKWVEQNRKDVENVKKWMDKMNLDKKHLVYDITNNTYHIEED